MDFGNIIRKRESISLAKKKRRHFLLPFRQKETKIKVPFLYVRRKKKTKFAESWKETKERDINKDSRSFFISFFIGNTVL